MTDVDQQEQSTRTIELLSAAELTQLATTTVNALEDSPVLVELCRRLVEAEGVDHAALALLRRDAVPVVAEYPDFNVRGTSLTLSAGITVQFKQTRQPFTLENVADAERHGFDRIALERQGIRSMALLPLLVGDHLIGVMTLDVYNTPHRFDSELLAEVLPALDPLAHSVHLADQNAQLRQRNAQLEMVNALASRVMTTFDLAVIFNTAREFALKALPADVVSIALMQPRALSLELYLLAEDGSPTLTEVPVDASGIERPARLAISEKEADVSQFPKLLDYQLLAQAGGRASVFVPLLIGDRSIGTLNLSHHESGFYAHADLALLEQIARPIAAALENAREYSNASRRADIENIANPLGATMQEFTDLSSLLKMTTQHLAETINARRARVRLQMPEGSGDPAFRSSTPSGDGSSTGTA